MTNSEVYIPTKAYMELDANVRVLLCEYGYRYKIPKDIRDVDKDFFCPWMEAYMMRYGVNVLELMGNVEDRLRIEGYTQSEIDLVKLRFSLGMFDCVSSSHFWIWSISIPTLVELPLEHPTKPFVLTLSQMHERQAPKTCRDPTISEMASQKWGEVFLAMREKKDGSPVYRVNPDTFGFPGRLNITCCSTWDRLEWCRDGFWGLYPYKIEDKLGSFNVKEAEWGLDLPKGEGVIILTLSGELRLKWTSTYERGGYEFDESDQMLRCRHGCDDSQLPVFSAHHLRPCSVSYDILTGEYDKPYPVVLDQGQVVLNIKRSVKPIKSVTWKGITTTDWGGGYLTVSVTANRAVKVVGCKMISVFEEEVYLFKDQDKKYDHIGGRLEPYETQLLCINREIYEETGLHLESQPVCIGFSESDGYGSFIYVANITLSMKNKMVKRSLVPLKDRAPWESRIYEFYKRKRDKVTTTSELVSYSVLVKQMTLAEKISLVDLFVSGVKLKNDETVLGDFFEGRFGKSRRFVYLEFLTIMGLQYDDQSGCYLLPVDLKSKRKKR